MKIPNASYFKLQRLSKEVKALNGIKDTNKLHCVKCNGNPEALKPFELKRSPILSFQLMDNENGKGIKAELSRKAKYRLVNNNLNLSSIFIEESSCYGFGYPNISIYLSNGKPNPLRGSKDIYLFIFNSDYSEIEIIVIPDGKGNQEYYFDELCKGNLDEFIKELRENAEPYFPYKGLML